MSEKSVEPKKGGKLKLIIMGILLVVLSVSLAFGGFYFYFSKKATSEVTVPHQLEGIVTYDLQEIKTNLKENKKVIQCTPAVSYEEENTDLAEEITKKETIIRNEIILYLGSKNSDEFSSDKIDILRKELVSRINQQLENGKINDIYFSALLIA